MKTTTLVFSVLAWLGAHVVFAKELPPNFLVIVADDLGYSDLGCYGGEIATPNLDSLAAGGLRFTQFYNTARCWPTRAALMTGYYPQQVARDGAPGAPRNFGGGGKRPPWAKTIAERLRLAGYHTYHSGKWHIDGAPTKNGFDRSDSISRGPGFFESTKRKSRDPSFYLTTATAEHAIGCLKKHSLEHSDEPFFQYLAFHAPHFPLHALPEDIARYRDRYVEGWEALRKERVSRQHNLRLGDWELSLLEPDVGPPYAFPDQVNQLGPGEVNRPLAWEKLSTTQRRFQATKMAIHAAMIDRMDREIGRVIEQIQDMDAWENTLICFLSDNGASAEIMVRGDGHDPEAPPGSAATYLCLGPGFSSACNTPFRRHKTWVHEGGISSPFIVHWPRGIHGKNEIRTAVSHVIDIAPTILDLADAKRPTNANGFPPMSGISLRATLQDKTAAAHTELWFYHEGNRALRQGNWKLIFGNKSRPFPYRRSTEAARQLPYDQLDWALYDLESDRAEQIDLSESHPERVQRMAERWEQLRVQFLADAARR